MSEKQSNASQAALSAIRIYCCCHSEDELYLNELEDHFAALIRQGKLEIWTHHKMLPGVTQQQEIARRLASSDIILFLASRYFFSSDAHWDIMERALHLREAGTVHVIPVRARPYDYEATPLGELQIFPRKKPLSQFTNRDDGYVEVVAGVREVIQKIQGACKEDKPASVVHEQRSEALSLAPAFSKSSPDPSLLVWEGDILFKHHCYDEALTAYETALHLDSNCIAAYQGKEQVLRILASLTHEKIKRLTILPFESVQSKSDVQEDLE